MVLGLRLPSVFYDEPEPPSEFESESASIAQLLRRRTSPVLPLGPRDVHFVEAVISDPRSGRMARHKKKKSSSYLPIVVLNNSPGASASTGSADALPPTGALKYHAQASRPRVNPYLIGQRRNGAGTGSFGGYSPDQRGSYSGHGGGGHGGGCGYCSQKGGYSEAYIFFGALALAVFFLNMVIMMAAGGGRRMPRNNKIKSKSDNEDEEEEKEREGFGLTGIVMAGGYGGGCCCGGGQSQGLDTQYLLLALGLATYILYQAINDMNMMMNKRRRRHLGILSSLEDFENKIDKLADSGHNGTVASDADDGWISKLYHSFSENYKHEDNEDDEDEDEDEDVALAEGLDPPIIDDAWNRQHSLEKAAPVNGTSVETSRKLSKREAKLRQEEADVAALFSGSATCTTKFWRCVSAVIDSGLQYGEEPGGFTGALKRHLMKFIFRGKSKGGMWNSLMKIPEARKLQRCLSKQSDCQTYAVLRESAETEQDSPTRLLVVPEAVEGSDRSDGSQEFDDEVMRRYREVIDGQRANF